MNDSKRSQIFTKVSRALTVAAKLGGSDSTSNSSLRLAIEKAKDAHMPKDVIQKAIDKGAGKGSNSENFEEITYEGYGPSGVAFMIKALTDNRNRTVGELRNIFNRHHGALGAAGSTAYIFNPDPENPSFFIEINDKEILGNLMILAEELEDSDDVQEVYTNFSVLE